MKSFLTGIVVSILVLVVIGAMIILTATVCYWLYEIANVLTQIELQKEFLEGQGLYR